MTHDPRGVCPRRGLTPARLTGDRPLRGQSPAIARAVLGIGGIGGMLAVRTGAVCVGTERTVDAIRANGLTLSTASARPSRIPRP